MNENVFLVIGLGTFGWETCEELAARGAKVIAVDNKPGRIEKIKEIVTQAILLDSTDEETLSTLPFEDVDLAVIAIGDNIEANILTTALLKKSGVPYIIARAATELHEQVLKQVGANEIINVEKEAGIQLAEKIIAPDILDKVPVTADISVAEVYVPEAFISKTLQNVDLPGKLDLTITAIKRTAFTVDEEGNPIMNESVVFPDGTTEFKTGDILLVVGKNDKIDSLKGI